MSALPEYEEVSEWFREQGLRSLPEPRKRPTRKGLGRFARDCFLHNTRAPEWWHQRWYACTNAYWLMLHLGVRIPTTTFTMDRIRVLADLERTESPNGREPADSWERFTRLQARRWASKGL